MVIKPFGSDDVTETDGHEHKETDELGGPKANHCHVVVVHGTRPAEIARVGREERSVAHPCIRCEEYEGIGDQATN